VAPVVVDSFELNEVSIVGLAGAMTYTEVVQALARQVSQRASGSEGLIVVGAHEAVRR
jgi:hypothetical protein